MADDNIFELSRRGMALLNAGLTTDSKIMLIDALGRLHGATLDANLVPRDQIAAAEALGKLLIDRDFPNHWFEEKSDG